MRYRTIKPVHRGREVIEAGRVFVPAEIEMTDETAKRLIEAGAVEPIEKRKKAEKREDSE